MSRNFVGHLNFYFYFHLLGKDCSQNELDTLNCLPRKDRRPLRCRPCRPYLLIDNTNYNTNAPSSTHLSWVAPLVRYAHSLRSPQTLILYLKWTIVNSISNFRQPLSTFRRPYLRTRLTEFHSVKNLYTKGTMRNHLEKKNFFGKKFFFFVNFPTF